VALALGESASILRLIFLVLILAGIIGLTQHRAARPAIPQTGRVQESAEIEFERAGVEGDVVGDRVPKIVLKGRAMQLVVIVESGAGEGNIATPTRAVAGSAARQ